ncbi:Unknown protein, partial [Striga hermonthica]
FTTCPGTLIERPKKNKSVRGFMHFHSRDGTHAGAAYVGRWDECMYPLRDQLGVHVFGDGGCNTRASQRSALQLASRLSAQACMPDHHFAWLHPARVGIRFKARSSGSYSGYGSRSVSRLSRRKVFRTGRPRIVDEWIQGLEFIFEVMECPDRYRVVCAQLQLTGDAMLWWNAYWSMRPGEKAGCTWDMFKNLVRDKYYPSYYRAEMERQFLALQQGTRTVDEYER